MELFLLRHGHSHANEANLVTGTRSDRLSPQGVAQAQSASRLLVKLGLADPAVHCFVSDWRRAGETAELAAPDRAFVQDTRLGETDAGTVADLPLDTFNRKHPLFWQEFDARRAYPGGESHQQLYDRVFSWFEEIQKTLPPEARVLAVTHAGPICCLLHGVCKVSMGDFPMFLAANISVTKLEKKAEAPWRLVFFSLDPKVAL